MSKRTTNQPRRRENADPYELGFPVPNLVLAAVALLLGWAVWYILTTQGDEDPLLGDRRTLSALQAKPGAAGGRADGAQLYASQCAACHQAGGAGLAGVFPPLAGSEWVVGDDKLAADIVLHGVTGALTVKGAQYQGEMPAFKNKLGDDEIAAVLTHVRSHFGNAAGPVGGALVKARRVAGSARSTPWNGDAELAARKTPSIATPTQGP